MHPTLIKSGNMTETLEILGAVIQTIIKRPWYFMQQTIRQNLIVGAVIL